MAILRPRLAILDETDSGLDIDALKIVADGVNALRGPDFSALVITHYQRLLDSSCRTGCMCWPAGGSCAPAGRSWRTSWRPRATPEWSPRRHDRSRPHRRCRLPRALRRRCATACRATCGSAMRPRRRSGARACRVPRRASRGGLEIHQPASAGGRAVPATRHAGRRRGHSAARLPRTDAPRIVFVDGEFRSELSTPPAAVGFSRFAEQGEFDTLARPDREPLVALNTMLAEEGAVLSVPAGVDAGLLLLVSSAINHSSPSIRAMRSASGPAPS